MLYGQGSAPPKEATRCDKLTVTYSKSSHSQAQDSKHEFFLITVTLSNVSGNRYDRRVGSDIKRFLKERTTGTTNGGVEMCEN